MQILFSDLNSMLVDPGTCSWQPATLALERIRQKRIPFVVVTNKTRAEVELWRDTTGIRYPFIVEGGGAVYFPKAHLTLPFRTKNKGQYEVLEFGTPHAELIADLKKASEMSGCFVRGFHEMSEAELSCEAALSPLQANLAKEREYSAPFYIVHGDPERLGRAIRQLGRRFTPQDSYFHITGNNQVLGAVRVLSQAFTLSYGPITTIGLGTGADDTFLKVMDRVVLATPASWNEAALTILQE